MSNRAAAPPVGEAGAQWLLHSNRTTVGSSVRGREVNRLNCVVQLHNVLGRVMSCIVMAGNWVPGDGEEEGGREGVTLFLGRQEQTSTHPW